MYDRGFLRCFPPPPERTSTKSDYYRIPHSFSRQAPKAGARVRRGGVQEHEHSSAIAPFGPLRCLDLLADDSALARLAARGGFGPTGHGLFFCARFGLAYQKKKQNLSRRRLRAATKDPLVFFSVKPDRQEITDPCSTPERFQGQGMFIQA